jgi:endonuclease YncB( thermonuclease family)
MLKKSFSVLFIVFLFSVNIFAQRYISGTVTQIVDGRTIIFSDKANSQITVQLQAIAVPDADQPLAAVVKEHLEKLLLGKAVSVQMKSISTGRVFLGDVDVSQQMLRDGAAWFNVPERNSQNSEDNQVYLDTENAAKAEKLGVWGVASMKPVWEFRVDKQKALEEQARIEQDKIDKENANNRSQIAKKTIPVVYKVPVILPDIIQGATFIDEKTETPKGFVVVGIGYLKADKEKLLKAVKKPETGDMVCTDSPVPQTFLVTQYGISNLCPYSGYGNNANYISNKAVLAKQFTQVALDKSMLAYRMYKISGNYAEYQPKGFDAINAIHKAVSFLPEGSLQNNLLYTADAIRDCLSASEYRMRDYGAAISGSFLIRLNDKYKFNDVSAEDLGDRINKIVFEYLNKSIVEAKKLNMY